MEKPRVLISKVSLSETLPNKLFFANHFTYGISFVEGFIVGKGPPKGWFAVDYTEWL